MQNMRHVCLLNAWLFVIFAHNCFFFRHPFCVFRWGSSLCFATGQSWLVGRFGADWSNSKPSGASRFCRLTKAKSWYQLLGWVIMFAYVCARFLFSKPRPAVIFVDCVYTIKMTQYFRRLGNITYVIFPRAVRNPAHGNVCGPLPCKGWRPCTRWNSLHVLYRRW